ncbi:short-chain dehydrogenase/reductase SDR [Nitritalea halalkaliphila LW7]|uniref:Short-chain dehydrogenase/reductase SDR n=1 Tax=Nitritalea halalkaliphila LW7 TaxID=1189621 RepID=I5C5M7_9BACT|nr:short-chain dehydrogenase/reductase SDR [Nitritalea halalkaliphila LW7]
MERNIIVTGAAGNLGQAVVEQFKREGYYVIAITQPGEEQEIEEADDIYELDVTDEEAVKASPKSISCSMAAWMLSPYLWAVSPWAPSKM